VRVECPVMIYCTTALVGNKDWIVMLRGKNCSEFECDFFLLFLWIIFFEKDGLYNVFCTAINVLSRNFLLPVW